MASAVGRCVIKVGGAHDTDVSSRAPCSWAVSCAYPCAQGDSQPTQAAGFYRYDRYVPSARPRIEYLAGRRRSRNLARCGHALSSSGQPRRFNPRRLDELIAPVREIEDDLEFVPLAEHVLGLKLNCEGREPTLCVFASDLERDQKRLVGISMHDIRSQSVSLQPSSLLVEDRWQHKIGWLWILRLEPTLGWCEQAVGFEVDGDVLSDA